MPFRPKHPCAFPLCPALVLTKYCDTHAGSARAEQRSADAARANASRRGYGWKWRVYAEAYVKRHPLCCYCSAIGRTSPTECVDHATPHKGDQRLLWDKSNHRPACIRCNSSKGDDDERTFLDRLRRHALA